MIACMCWCCRLSLNSSGGQCLDEEGSRVRRWSWSSLTPLQPVFLSLNKSVGVRVLGREHVFVSFLARGQQAKFNVGDCCVQVKQLALFFFTIFHVFCLHVYLAFDTVTRSAWKHDICFPLQNECKTVWAAPPGPLKEDLFVKAARIRIQLLLQNMHQILLTPSCARLPKTKLAAQRRAEAQKLLEVTADVMMEESERDFIHRCLHSCLWCTIIKYKYFFFKHTECLNSESGLFTNKGLKYYLCANKNNSNSQNPNSLSGISQIQQVCMALCHRAMHTCTGGSWTAPLWNASSQINFVV